MIQDKHICISLLLQISSESLRQEIITSISQYGKTEIKNNEKYIWCFFTIWNLKSAVTYKCGWVVLFLRSVYIAISKLILLFSHILFMYHALYFPTFIFTMYATCFPFFLIDHNQKHMLLIKWVIFFLKDKNILFALFNFLKMVLFTMLLWCWK